MNLLKLLLIALFVFSTAVVKSTHVEFENDPFISKSDINSFETTNGKDSIIISNKNNSFGISFEASRTWYNISLTYKRRIDCCSKCSIEFTLNPGLMINRTWSTRSFTASGGFNYSFYKFKSFEFLLGGDLFYVNNVFPFGSNGEALNSFFLKIHPTFNFNIFNSFYFRFDSGIMHHIIEFTTIDEFSRGFIKNRLQYLPYLNIHLGINF